MNVYHGWFDLKPGVGDLEFAEALAKYMGHLKDAGLLEGWHLTRRKLGLGPPELGEFHVAMEFEDMRQLEDAFEKVAGRRDPTEAFHFGVNSQVTNVRFALYRDFPDPVRHEGEERF